MSSQTKLNKVIVYADTKGKEPFTDWLYNLRDAVGRRRILVRIGRLEQGNYGDCAPIGAGLSELRLFFGSGYRVYFGQQGGVVIVLLCGGDKATQSKDIRQAKLYWEDYLRHEKIQNIH